METKTASNVRPAQFTHGAAPQSHGGGVTVTPARTDPLIRLSRVIEMTSLSKSSIYADKALAAKRVRLSSRLVAWRESDVLGWISERSPVVDAK